MTTQTLDQVLSSARQLAPRERARLVAVLVEELAEPPVPVADDLPGDVLAELDQLISEAAAAGPTEGDSADLISAMRR